MDLSIQKYASPNPVAPGQSLQFTLAVSNAGPATALNVSVTDPLPVGTIFVSCASSQGLCTGPPVGANGTVTADLGSLTSGGSATITIVVQVTVGAGQLLNTATVTTTSNDRDPDNNASSATSVVGSPIPTLSPTMMALLALALAALGLFALRRP